MSQRNTILAVSAAAALGAGVLIRSYTPKTKPDADAMSKNSSGIDYHSQPGAAAKRGHDASPPASPGPQKADDDSKAATALTHNQRP